MTKSSSPSRLDAFFGNPAAAVGMAVVCNVLWGSAFPFIKMGYRLFAIDATDTASIMCFAGVRFMLSALLVYAGGAALRRGPLPMPKGKNLLSCCGLGLWQTAAQYTFYYSAVALLTGAMGGILNSTQSFMGVILAHFLYGKADRMTPRKAIGCALGFSGVLVATLGNHGSGSPAGVAYMLIASVIFALAGPWNKAVTQKVDSFTVSCLNLGVGGAALLVIGLVLGGSLHPQSFGAVPVLLFLAVYLRCRLCDLGTADEKQPCFPHCRVRSDHSDHERSALRHPERRAPVRMAIPRRPCAGVRGDLFG